jgi:hypothetical protein
VRRSLKSVKISKNKQQQCHKLEPILQENKNRFVIPIKHHDIWEWYKKMEASFDCGRNRFISRFE